MLPRTVFFDWSSESNIAYTIGLSERDKRLIEAAEIGRVHLSHSEAADLSLTKVVHVAIVMISNLCSVWMIGKTKGKPIGIMILWPPVAFWIGGIIEAACASMAQAQSDSESQSD